MDDKVKETINHVVLNGTLKNVQDILENHKLVCDDSLFDYELLKLALRREDEEVANYLMLEKGCRARNPYKNDLGEETPLYLAIELNKIGCIQIILQAGASIYDKNHLGRLPIYEAFSRGYMDVCKEILHYCCHLKTLNPKNKDDVLHFHIACVLNVVNAVKIYLAFEFDVNGALSLDDGKYVFQKGISLETIQIYPGMTPLHFASESGYVEIVELLVENEADIGVRDATDKTPLTMAISSYTENLRKYPYMFIERELSRKVVEILLEKKPRLYLEDIFFLYEWDTSLIDILFLEFAQFYQIIYVNIQKLVALNLHSCEFVQEFCDVLNPRYKRAESITDRLIDLDRVKDDCEKELEKMKLVIIDADGTSLHSILFKDSQELSKYIRKSDFCKIVNDEKIEELFPFYGYLLKLQYKNGVRHPLKYSKSSLERSVCPSCSGGGLNSSERK